jgi:hypothetical protein
MIVIKPIKVKIRVNNTAEINEAVSTMEKIRKDHPNSTFEVKVIKVEN